MTRREELTKYIREKRPDDESILRPLVDDVIYLEVTMDELRKLPMVERHPSDQTKVRPSGSAKLYKELLQQYNNCMKLILVRESVNADGDEESPLRQYMKSRLETR